MKTSILSLVVILVIMSHVISLVADDHIFTLPVSGNDLRVSAGWYYQDGTAHGAVDYVSSSGTGVINGRDIYAAYGGVVIQVVSNVPDNTGTGYGNYVKIDHQNGYMSLYGHMLYNSPIVSVGNIVIQGQVIGRVGNTGNSTGYHLHFQIWKNGAPVDPYGWYCAPDINGSPYTSCNLEEYYFTENLPIHAPSSLISERTVPDDVILHVIGTPDYFWIQDGIMNHFDSEYPLYTWNWGWDEAIEATQDEVSQFQAGPDVKVRVGACVYDENSQRWVFDYASDTSFTIVRRRATAWQSLGYASDVWIPVTSSFLSNFNEGTELISEYPYGAVLKNQDNNSERFVLVKGEIFGNQYIGQKMKLPIFSNDAYNINYYHYNFNIPVSSAVLNNYPTAPTGNYEYIMDGKLVKGSASQIYYLENGHKRHILDATTFSYYGFSYANVVLVSDNDINAFPTGPQITFSPSGGDINFDGLELNDGGFDSGLTSYWHFNDWSQIADFDITSENSIDGVFKAEVQVNTPANYYDVELKQLIDVTNRGLYHFSFWVKSDTNLPFKVELIKDTSPWTNYGLWKELNSTTEWKKHQYVFNTTGVDPLARLSFMLGESAGARYFDKVVFEDVSNISPPENQLLANGNFELGHYAPFLIEDHNTVADYYADEYVDSPSNIYSMYIDPNQSGLRYQVQLVQNVNLVSGASYTLSFLAKAEMPRSIFLECSNIVSPWENFGLWEEKQIGTEWIRYTTQFVASHSGESRICFQLGHQDIGIWLDNISLALSGTSSIEDDVYEAFNIKIYPNPFRDNLKISYDVVSNKSVCRIQIFNIKGQIVKEFSHLKKNGEIIWDAKDDFGKEVSSGIYFCSVEGGDKLKPIKLLYLK